MTRPLVITADDFGLAIPLTTGIIAAHRGGVVTAASFIVTSTAFAESLRLAKETPSLDIGVHLTAVGGGPPVLPPSEVGSLLTRGGCFPEDWRGFLARLLMRRVDLAELSREFGAQIKKLLDCGIRPSHLDSHQHIHLFPPVAGVVLDLARTYSIPFLRAPRALARGLRARGVNFFSRRLAARGRDRAVPSYGFDVSGHLDRDSFLDLLAALGAAEPPGPAEIFSHPGFFTDAVHWEYDWEGEHALLTDPGLRGQIGTRGFVLTSFSALAGGVR